MDTSWVNDALHCCERATAAKCLILMRNDDEEIIVTNASDAATVRELGEALACGYTKTDEED